MHHSVQYAGRTWNGVFSIQNMNPTQANVQVIFYDLNGQQVVSGQLIPVGVARWAIPLRWQQGPQLPSTWHWSALLCYLKIVVERATNPWLASAGRGISGCVRSSGMYNALTPDAGNTVYLPAVKTNASGAGGNRRSRTSRMRASVGCAGQILQSARAAGRTVNAPFIQAYSSFHLSSQQFGTILGFDGSVVVSSPSPVAVVNSQLGTPTPG